MRLYVDRIWPLAALVLLGGCLGSGGGNARPGNGSAAAQDGPAADYPIVIGEAFTIGEVTHTPADKMNYDAVGRAAVGSEASGAGAISGAHKTLSVPSYAEVTSLDSGRTILVRVERRGPMRNDRLIELSGAAATQLGIADASPVRVRRVNPPEAERALLRSGQQAPPRMETPKSLLGVLLRKLDAPEGIPAAKTPLPGAAPVLAPSAPAPRPTASAVTPSAPAPTAAQSPARTGEFHVQAAVFSTQQRADTAAAAVGGYVVAERTLWHLRLGPFETQAQADAGLAKARAGGYSDARIRRAD